MEESSFWTDTPEYRKAVGQVLRELREEKRRTQENVAKDLDIERKEISEIETGKTKPGPRRITDLLRVYGGTPQTLNERVLKQMEINQRGNDLISQGRQSAEANPSDPNPILSLKIIEGGAEIEEQAQQLPDSAGETVQSLRKECLGLLHALHPNTFELLVVQVGASRVVPRKEGFDSQVAELIRWADSQEKWQEVKAEMDKLERRTPNPL